MILSILSFVLPAAHAYGTSNWQVGFSGNCDNKTICGGTFGFWGWCAFSGGVNSGNEADCQMAFYSFSANGNFGPLQTAIMGTAWNIGPSSMTRSNDFFITAGTVSFHLPPAQEGPLPPACTISGTTATCPIPAAEAIHIYSPDTLILVVPGHISSTMCFVPGPPISAPGCNFNQQLTQVPA